jgi:hypothetical protein
MPPNENAPRPELVEEPRVALVCPDCGADLSAALAGQNVGRTTARSSTRCLATAGCASIPTYITSLMPTVTTACSAHVVTSTATTHRVMGGANGLHPCFDQRLGGALGGASRRGSAARLELDLQVGPGTPSASSMVRSRSEFNSRPSRSATLVSHSQTGSTTTPARVPYVLL